VASVFSIENVRPSILRKAISEGQISKDTSEMCKNYLQANVLILPKSHAKDFEKNEKLSSYGCRILEVLDSGVTKILKVASNADVREAIPKYRIFINGEFLEDREEIKDIWQDDFVTFVVDSKCDVGKKIFGEILVKNNSGVTDFKPEIMITNVPGHKLITDIALNHLN